MICKTCNRGELHSTCCTTLGTSQQSLENIKQLKKTAQHQTNAPECMPTTQKPCGDKTFAKSACYPNTADSATNTPINATQEPCGTNMLLYYLIIITTRQNCQAGKLQPHSSKYAQDLKTSGRAKQRAHNLTPRNVGTQGYQNMMPKHQHLDEA